MVPLDTELYFFFFYLIIYLWKEDLYEFFCGCSQSEIKKDEF